MRVNWITDAYSGSQQIPVKEAEAARELEEEGELTEVERLQTPRPDLMVYTYNAYRSLVEPDDPGEVSLDERDFIALRIATLASCGPLVRRHLERLRTRGVSEEVIQAAAQNGEQALLGDRAALLLDYTDQLYMRPYSMNRSTVGSYREAGLSERVIVTITQLVSYMSYHVRLVFGLGLKGEEV